MLSLHSRLIEVANFDRLIVSHNLRIRGLVFTVDWSTPFIVFVKRNELHFVGVDFVGGKAGQAFFKVGEAETITALDFDYSTRTIYLSAGDAKNAGTTDDRYQAQGTIMRIDLNGNQYRR